MLVYIDILVYAYAVINRDDLVRGVNTRSLLTDFGCNRRNDILSTLTTGCSKLWLAKQERYMTGLECLSFHSIPATAELAMAMRCRQVEAGEVSHAMQCFMAGNSMHCANVGACVALCLFGTSLRAK